MRDYISKIIDRNRQKKNESGITNYVLYSLFILVSYKAFYIYEKIPFEENPFRIIELSMYSLNICLAIYYLYLSFLLAKGNSSKLRMIKNPVKNDNYFQSIILFLLLVIPLTAVIIFISNSIYYQVKLNWFVIVLIIVNLFSLFLLIFFAILNNKNKKQNKESFDILTGTNIFNTKSPSILFFVTSCFIISYSFYYLLQTKININKIEVFVFFGLLYFLIVILDFILKNEKENVFTKELENLEYEIHMKDLSDDEIRKVLQSNYLGFPLPEWIKFKYENLDSLKDKFEKRRNNILESAENLENKKNELDELSFKKLLLDHTEINLHYMKDVRSYFEKSNDEMNKIGKNMAGLTQLEINELVELTKKHKEVSKKLIDIPKIKFN